MPVMLGQATLARLIVFDKQKLMLVACRSQSSVDTRVSCCFRGHVLCQLSWKT
jgi:hypothetical protein